MVVLKHNQAEVDVGKTYHGLRMSRFCLLKDDRIKKPLTLNECPAATFVAYTTQITA